MVLIFCTVLKLSGSCWQNPTIPLVTVPIKHRYERQTLTTGVCEKTPEETQIMVKWQEEEEEEEETASKQKTQGGGEATQTLSIQYLQLLSLEELSK